MAHTHTHECSCCGCEKCEHSHEHEHESRVFIIIRLIISAVLLGFAIISEHYLHLNEYIVIGVYIAAFLIVGYEVVLTVLKNLIRFDIHDIFDEEFLMLCASVGAICLGEYPEAVVIMLFWQTGEMFQDVAVDKSRESIEKLMYIRPEYANVLSSDGNVKKTDPSEVSAGEIIVVKTGEKIPLDGIVVSGECRLNTAALTGESALRRVKEGDEVLSGCINCDGLVRIRTTSVYENSAVAKILALIEKETESKSKSENFITRFAKVYTPIVVLAAVLLAVLPPLVTGSMDFSVWVHRALMFLVVSCPCALVISVPLAFFGGVGRASANGVLLKGSACMDALARMKTVALDKTGTLTEGRFAVTDIIPAQGVSEKHLMDVAISAELMSNHPIAVAICGDVKTSPYNVLSYEETAGQGIAAEVDIDGQSTRILVGNKRLMDSNGISVPENSASGVYAAKDGEYAGCICVEDKIKSGAEDAVKDLKKEGCTVIMLTGDRESAAKIVADKLGIEYRAELLPQDKVSSVHGLMTGGVTAFAGDGINDTPVIAAADIGIAMGGLGQDAAIEAADVVIMDDDVKKIAFAKRLSVKTLTIAKENIVFALAVKAVVLLLGALGIANMYFAVFADVGVSLLCVFNSLRILKYYAKISNK